MTKIFKEIPTKEGSTPTSAHDRPPKNQIVFVPQANSPRRLFELLNALASGPMGIDDLALTLDVSSRTIGYYRQLATWLDFARSPRPGHLELTDHGRRLVQQPSAQMTLFAEALLARELCRRVMAARRSSETLEATATKIIMEMTSLSPLTAQRRATALARLLQATVNFDAVDDDALNDDALNDNRTEIAARRGEPIGRLNPDSFIERKLPAMGIYTVGDILDFEMKNIRKTSGIGAKGATLIRALHGRAREYIRHSHQTASAEQMRALSANHPVDVLEPPGLIHRILDELAISTVKDVLDLDLETIADMRGVGPGKIKKFRELKARASQLIENETGVDKLSISEQLEQAGCPRNMPISKIAYLLPIRLVNVANAQGIDTFAELVEMRHQRQLRKLPKLGASTLKALDQLVADILDSGLEIMLYGDRGKPNSIDELYSWALDTCDERSREILAGRYIQETLLEDLGNDFGVTRERIRQIEARELARLAMIYGDVAGELTEEIRSILHQSAGFVHYSTLEGVNGPNQLAKTLFALHLFGEDDAYRWKEEFLTIIQPENRGLTFERLKSTLLDLDELRVEIDDAVECANRMGIPGHGPAISRMLDVIFDIQINDDAFTIPWMNISDVVAGLVADIGRPAKTDEIAAAYEDKRQDPAVELPPQSKYNLRANLERSEEIYNYGHGIYVHVDNLPLAIADLNSAVEWAAHYLRGRPDQVSVEYLIDELHDERLAPPGLTPHLLKSALNRRPDVISFKNTLLVAHAESYAD